MSIVEIITSLVANPVFAGLSGTAVVAGLMYWARKVPQTIWFLFTYMYTVRITVKQGDLAFEWIDKWLAEHPSAKKSNSLKLVTDNYEQNTFILTAGYGTRLLWIDRWPYVLHRTLNEPTANSGKAVQESITLVTVGKSQKAIRDLVAQAHQNEIYKSSVSIRAWDNYWRVVAGKEARELGSIVLQRGQMERILEDLNWFSTAKDWYKSRGIPYRRGYLFSGPPGTGKTSIVLALGAYLKRPVCLLNLGSVQNDNDLFRALLDAPINAIILIEDIDCAMSSTDRRKDKMAQSNLEEAATLTTAGLLNALDGVLTPEGRIIIMTTNNPEKLDAAIIRPGRADVHEVFNYLAGAQQTKLAAKFYADEFIPLAKPVSPAQMQAVFMRNPTSMVDARNELDKPTLQMVAKA